VVIIIIKNAIKLVVPNRLYKGFDVTNNDGSVLKIYTKKEYMTFLFNFSEKLPEYVKSNDNPTNTENNIDM